MQASEIAEKNTRVRFWKAALNDGALDKSQQAEMRSLLTNLQTILLNFGESGAITTEKEAELSDLERRLDQLAELSRLESGKSKLLAG